jgi:energy-coupling factor transporter ATP-binding protein EcfA2
MLRRLALARLIVTRPPVALLDEPYAGLDEEGRELLDRLLAELRGEGRTAIVATHERERALALADGVTRLDRGIVETERPALLQAHA